MNVWNSILFETSAVDDKASDFTHIHLFFWHPYIFQFTLSYSAGSQAPAWEPTFEALAS